MYRDADASALRVRARNLSMEMASHMLCDAGVQALERTTFQVHLLKGRTGGAMHMVQFCQKPPLSTAADGSQRVQTRGTCQLTMSEPALTNRVSAKQDCHLGGSWFLGIPILSGSLAIFEELGCC